MQLACWIIAGEEVVAVVQESVVVEQVGDAKVDDGLEESASEGVSWRWSANSAKAAGATNFFSPFFEFSFAIVPGVRVSDFVGVREGKLVRMES